MTTINKIFLFLVIVFAVSLITVGFVLAWSGPSTNPPTGSGLLYYSGSNVGIGTTNPVQKLDVNGTVQAIGFKLPTGASSGYVLTSDTNGVGTWLAAAGGGGGTQLWATSGTAIYNTNSGNVGIGTGNPVTSLTIYNGEESTTQTDFTQALTKAGINVVTDYTDNAYTPGIFWSTQDNYSSKPKAGIYMKITSVGSNLYFGTTNNWSAGITNNAMIIDHSGQVNMSAPVVTGTLTVSNGGSGAFTMVGNPSTGNVMINNANTAGGDIDIQRRGNSAIFIQGSSGNVGIGTTNPVQKLDINGTVQMTGFKLPTGATNGYVLTSDTNGVGTWTAAGGGAGGWTDDGAVVRLTTATDNVGIGTTNPVDKFEVVGGIHSSSYALAVKANEVILDELPGTGGAGGIPGEARLLAMGPNTSTNGSITLQTRRSDNSNILDALFISPTGNVGIGTTAPSEKFQVQGTGETGMLLKTTGAASVRLKMTPDANGMAGIQGTTGWMQIGTPGAIAFGTGTGGGMDGGYNERMRIDATGNVGIGTTAIGEKFVIKYAENAGRTDDRAFVIDGIGNPQDGNWRFVDFTRGPDAEFVITGDGNVRADGSFASPADYAEYFYSDDTSFKPGELVCIAGEKKIKRCDAGDSLIGIVSTKPGVIGIFADDVTDAAESYEKDPHWVKVGLLGQVPVKVSVSNGTIKAGDQLAAGDNGLAVKGASPRTLLMLALENADEDGTIRVLIK